MQEPLNWKTLRQTTLGHRLLMIGALCLLAVVVSVACLINNLGQAQETQAELQQAQTQLQQARTEIVQLQDEIDEQTKSLARLDSLTSENGELKEQIATLQNTADSQKAQITEKDTYISQLEAKLSAASSAKSSGSAAASTSSSSSTSSTTKSQTVYITKTGSKYHRSGCQYLKKSKISISLADAKAQGYTACSKCY